MAKTILVVDNSASMRQVMTATLKDAGYDVIEAVDGKDALSRLDGVRIHLVISDVNMPNMDGIEFLKTAKQLPTYKFTPFIMLISEGGESLKRDCQAAGAKAWVMKPFQPAKMLAAVSKLVTP